MPTPNQPNNPNQPKKPAEKTGDTANKPTAGGNGQPTPGAKPNQSAGQTGAQKPTPNPSSAKTPPMGAPAGKPAVSKPGSTPAPKPGAGSGPASGQGSKAPQPPAKKAQPAKNRFSHIDANTLQLARKIEDLGFLDGAQIEAIYEQMRTSDATLGELAIQSGLMNEDQLLQATAEAHGMRVANLEDVKPEPAAIKIVQKPMAELYKLVPLSYENDVLTVRADWSCLMRLQTVPARESPRRSAEELALERRRWRRPCPGTPDTSRRPGCPGWRRAGRC